jgi:plastocyanin
MIKITLLLLPFLLIAAIACAAEPGSAPVSPPTPTPDAPSGSPPVTEPPPAPESTPGEISFDNPRKAPHYESNTPEHGDILAGVPINITIDFNFDLASGSAISVMNDGKEYGIGELIIDDNKLAMRRSVAADAPDGLYTVSYKACWPDGSCHDGSFQFAIDRTKTSDFTDERGKNEVSIAMQNIAFVPQKIRIDKGASVTWTNNDSAVHYINTDSHPYHTYFPPQNSKALNKGDVFVLVFEQAGIYPYHCSAHTNMTGTILVE